MNMFLWINKLFTKDGDYADKDKITFKIFNVHGILKDLSYFNLKKSLKR